MSTIGEKIRIARHKAGMTQAQLALGICEKSYISKIENNSAACIDEKILGLIKERLSITKATLTPNDIIELKNLLYKWLGMIKHKQIEEANTLKPELEESVKESGDPDIEILFTIFNSYYNLYNGENNIAYDSLMHLKIDYLFTNEQRYYYNYCLGIYYGVLQNCKQALRHLLAAENLDFSLKHQDYDLFYIIANLFTGIDYSSKAILYGNKAKDISRFMSDSTRLLKIEIILALNYNKTGESDLAEEILVNCLHSVKSYNNERLIFSCYHNLGCTYLRKEMFKKAKTSFDEAFKYCTKSIYNKVNNILFVAYCLIGDGSNKEALRFIEEGLILSKQHNLTVLTILLESLQFIQSPLTIKTIGYIKDITIPTLVENGMYLKAIDFCKILGNYFLENKKFKNSGIFFKLANKYYQMILRGEL